MEKAVKDRPEQEAEPQAPDPEAAPSRKPRSLLRSMGTVSSITMLSRVLGLVRDGLMTAAFGLSAEADAFLIAWTLPNLFRRLCGEGALSSAFLPVFVELKEKGGVEAALALARATVTRLALGLAALLLVFEVGLYAGGEGLVGLFEDGDYIREALRLSALLLPYLWFICIAGLVSGLLQSEGDFGRPAALAVVLNIVWIGALVATGFLELTPSLRIAILSVALVLGGALQMGLQLQGAARLGFSIRPRLESAAGLGKVAALFLPLAFGMAVEQLNVLSDRLIAGTLLGGEGGVAALYYSMRLVQLPVALIGIALATVLFPRFARLAARGDRAGLNAALDQSLRITLFATVPAAAGLAVLAPDIIALLFERGAFAAEDSARTAACLLAYAPSVVLISLSASQVRAYYAIQDSRTPVRVGVAAVGLNLALNLALVGPLGEVGLALATSAASLLSFAALAWLFGGARLTSQAAAGLRALALSAVMAGACLGARWLIPADRGSPLAVSAAVAVGVAVYAGLALVTRSPELRAFLSLRRGED